MTPPDAETCISPNYLGTLHCTDEPSHSEHNDARQRMRGFNLAD